jgi:hypothetical protein
MSDVQQTMLIRSMKEVVFGKLSLMGWSEEADGRDELK